MLAPVAITLFACSSRAPAPEPAAPGPPEPVPVALTFDDLPYQTRRGGAPIESDPAVWARTTGLILETLARHEAPAAVFVNCGNLPDATLVDRWRAAGHTVGNHTAHHQSAAHTTPEEWLADVDACDDLAPSGTARWFRYPYLWRGETPERRDALSAALTERGYRVAPVTVDSHDWAFEMTRQQSPAALEPLAEMLVDNVADALREARAVSRDKLGRESGQVVLLHLNQVTAAAMPAMLDRLATEGLAITPLSDVLGDPAFAAPDAWAGRGSRMWLERTEPTERPDGSAWYTDRESRVTATLRERFASD